MKCSKAAIHRKTHCIPEVKFEDQRLTSFAGLVVFQSLFSRIGLKRQLTRVFPSSKSQPDLWPRRHCSVADCPSPVGLSPTPGYALLPG